MALVTVGHPIPGLTAYERFDDFSLAFVGGISGRINLSTGQQAQLTGLGYVINPATPAYESPYVLDSELESQLPARLSPEGLRAAFGAALSLRDNGDGTVTLVVAE